MVQCRESKRIARLRRRRLLSLLALVVAGLSLLALGALKARQEYLTRGLPGGLPLPITGGGVRPGINVDLSRYDDQALADNLAQIQAAGFTHLKQSFYYAEPFDWAASDRLIAAVAASGLGLVPLLDGNPADNFAPPADPPAYAAWAGAFAARYQDQLDAYIIWDEPNLSSHWGNQPVNPAGYAALLAAAAQAIRAADPDALIVAAPLAPTAETSPDNLADPLYLQALYEAGAAGSFDIAAGKPYGFSAPPEDRAVHLDTLNFSRAILLREVMERNGDGHKALWAGNWGWNSLPADWQGSLSIWGQVDEATQAAWTVAALERARQEWPWMGLMFLESWQPAAPPGDPRWGFAIAGRATAAVLAESRPPSTLAHPGFYLARPTDPAQNFAGGWRFSPEFGADINQSDDSVMLRFWGTDAGVRVRRADFRARFYATVDGQPANALPRDERGAFLVLTSPGEEEDYLAIEWLARNLPPGEHTLTLVAYRGWGQWALNGFSVAYHPPDTVHRTVTLVMGLLALASLGLAVWSGWGADWGTPARRLSGRVQQLDQRRQLLLTSLVAALVALTGWLTWGEQVAGLYRRLGDGGQLVLTAAAASIFYVAPPFLVYVLALALLCLLLAFRPAWGLALVAFSAPFFVKPKPILGYRFSPVEIFLLATLAATLFSKLLAFRSQIASTGIARPKVKLLHADYAVLALVAVATLSLFFTERLDVATNEWRVVVLEPALFYFLLRWNRLQEAEMWTVLDFYVLGGLAVALIGLGKLATPDVITAEGGLVRLQSIYGSPNNVALYLGRLIPLLVAMALLGRGHRRLAYAAALLPIGLATLLTFSKGALFLGIPAGLLVVFVIWQRATGRPVWPWLAGAALAGVVGLAVILQIPQLAGRLNPFGETGLLRVYLWRSSLSMFRDHPLFGVGLDNFLYAYRGRYILDAAWQEPDLNHPHNIVLDFATRLGLLGLLSGGWLFWSFWQSLRRLPVQVPPAWRPVAAGLAGALANILVHGLVDHSFFLVDLAYAFFLLLALAVYLKRNFATNKGFY